MAIRRFFHKIHGRSRLGGLLIILVVGGVFGVALVREWDALMAFEWQIRWRYLPLMAILHFLALGAMFAAWQGMMINFTDNKNWRSNLRIYSLSILARRIPLPIWYVGSRLYFYKQENVSMAKIASATTLEIVLISFSGLICYLLLPESSTKPWLWIPVLGMAGGILIVSVIQPNLLVKLINYGLGIFKKEPLDVVLTRAKLLLWSIFYLGTWLLDGLGLYFTIRALTATAFSLPAVIGISTLSALVAAFSLFLPGGLGLKELTMSALLSVWLPFSVGMVIAITYRLLNTILEIAWAGMGHIVTRQF